MSSNPCNIVNKTDKNAKYNDKFSYYNFEYLRYEDSKKYINMQKK